MTDNILNTVKDMHNTSPFVVLFAVLPENTIGDAGATALAGALVHLKSLTEFDLGGPCVPRWCALVIGSDSSTKPY